MVEASGKDVKNTVLQELKTIRSEEKLEARSDWDLVWVLSGPQKTFDVDDENSGEGGNETKHRLITGFNLVKEITAVRLDKKVSEVTVSDISSHGPKIYFNGWNDQNDNIKNMRDAGFFEDNFDIPRGALMVAGSDGIEITPDQFRKFPSELLTKEGKIVLVTDAYHLPRVIRIAKRKNIDGSPNIVPFEKLVFYPSDTLRFPLKETRNEIRKIPKLIKEGLLPREET